MGSANHHPKRYPLPRLPFGREKASTSHDIRAFTDAVSETLSSLGHYDALGDPQDFGYASARLAINGLEIIGSASTAVSYAVENAESNNLYAVLPCPGVVDVEVDGYSSTYQAADGIYLSPEIRRAGKTSAVSMVQMSLDRDRLVTTASAMLGEAARHRVKEHLQHPHILKYRQGGVRYDHVFGSVYRTMDELRLDPILLGAMGLDDILYRSFVMMLNPEALNAEGSYRSGSDRSAPVVLACEYMRANYQHTITLTALEQVTQLSARSLQLAFQKECGCTPMTWLKHLRLDLVHERLSHPQDDDTVTRVAYACGFNRLDAFAQAYERRFGELPSATLAGGKPSARQ